MTDEQKKLTRLYDLKNRAIKEHRKDDEAALAWAIFMLEQIVK